MSDNHAQVLLAIIEAQEKARSDWALDRPFSLDGLPLGIAKSTYRYEWERLTGVLHEPLDDHANEPVGVEAPKPEARQWVSGNDNEDLTAVRLVRWVNAHGGDALYEPACLTDWPHDDGGEPHHGARIALRRADGTEAFVYPGDWIVMSQLLWKYMGYDVPMAQFRDFFPSKEQPS